MTNSSHSSDLKVNRIIDRMQCYAGEGKRIFATSSFQTHSLPLLHIISRLDIDVPVVFIDTGYLFPDTLRFRDKIKRLLSLNIIDAKSNVPKSEQRAADGRLLFAADPGKCCYLNKVAPLEPYLREYDVWVNGIRAEQNLNRSTFVTEQSAPYGTIRFHPLLAWTMDEVREYCHIHGLPTHPLSEKGFFSIGCMPCTVRAGPRANVRDSRWPGQRKSECGLHTELAGNSRQQQ